MQHFIYATFNFFCATRRLSDLKILLGLIKDHQCMCFFYLELKNNHTSLCYLCLLKETQDSKIFAV